jgi:spermidine synthase
VPFHLLTKEFYTLVKQHLAPAAPRVQRARRHQALRLDAADPARGVSGVHLYPSGEGEVIVVVTGERAAGRDAETRAQAHAGEIRLPLPAPGCWRAAPSKERSTQTGEMLTDDFAPVNLYDTIGDKKRKK